LMLVHDVFDQFSTGQMPIEKRKFAANH
jgi:hypothetical protein